ncbi:uncharacterized protein METZ01_LOCUS409798, partial [marine metagenome]
IVIVILSCSIVVSGQGIITDRPDQTESSLTIQVKSLQIESGLLLEFLGEDGLNSERSILAPTTLIRYGLLDFAEVRIVSQIENIKNKSNNITGIKDLEIGAKLQLLKKKQVSLEIALLSHLIIPSGSKEVTGNTSGLINKVCVSHKTNSNIDIGYNLGYNYFDDDSESFTYSVVIGLGINERASIYFEPYGEVLNLDKNLTNINSGITYLLRDNFQLDFSFGSGINYTFNYVATGFSWNISAD